MGCGTDSFRREGVVGAAAAWAAAGGCAPEPGLLNLWAAGEPSCLFQSLKPRIESARVQACPSVDLRSIELFVLVVKKVSKEREGRAGDPDPGDADVLEGPRRARVLARGEAGPSG